MLLDCSFLPCVVSACISSFLSSLNHDMTVNTIFHILYLRYIVDMVHILFYHLIFG